jgi:hypothetical protein
VSRRAEERGSRRQRNCSFRLPPVLVQACPVPTQICAISMIYDEQPMTFVSYVKFSRFPVCNNLLPTLNYSVS